MWCSSQWFPRVQDARLQLLAPVGYPDSTLVETHKEEKGAAFGHPKLGVLAAAASEGGRPSPSLSFANWTGVRNQVVVEVVASWDANACGADALDDAANHRAASPRGRDESAAP